VLEEKGELVGTFSREELLGRKCCNWWGWGVK
jgi:hypothetical protein